MRKLILFFRLTFPITKCISDYQCPDSCLKCKKQTFNFTTWRFPEEEKPRVQEENKETSMRNDKTEKNDNNKVQEKNEDTTREENKETEELLDSQDKRVNALLWLVDKIILFIKQVFRKRK